MTNISKKGVHVTGTGNKAFTIKTASSGLFIKENKQLD